MLLQINFALVDKAMHLEFGDQPLPYILKYVQAGAFIFVLHSSTNTSSHGLVSPVAVHT